MLLSTLLSSVHARWNIVMFMHQVPCRDIKWKKEEKSRARREYSDTTTKTSCDVYTSRGSCININRTKAKLKHCCTSTIVMLPMLCDVYVDPHQKCEREENSEEGFQWKASLRKCNIVADERFMSWKYASTKFDNVVQWTFLTDFLIAKRVDGVKLICIRC